MNSQLIKLLQTSIAQGLSAPAIARKIEATFEVKPCINRADLELKIGRTEMELERVKTQWKRHRMNSLRGLYARDMRNLKRQIEDYTAEILDLDIQETAK